jgi:hypothetical protein
MLSRREILWTKHGQEGALRISLNFCIWCMVDNNTLWFHKVWSNTSTPQLLAQQKLTSLSSLSWMGDKYCLLWRPGSLSFGVVCEFCTLCH